MAGDYVIDTSVLAKSAFDEPGSDEVRAWMESGPGLIAPRHILVEFASVAFKKARDGLCTVVQARNALERTPSLLSEIVDNEPLLDDALNLALAHRVSLYDALFAALSLDRSAALVTADLAFKVRLAQDSYPGQVLLPADLS